jgi:hypothetical protein
VTEVTPSVEVGGKAFKTTSTSRRGVQLPLFVVEVEFRIVSSVLTFCDSVVGLDVMSEAAEVHGVFDVSVKREAV